LIMRNFTTFEDLVDDCVSAYTQESLVARK